MSFQTRVLIGFFSVCLITPAICLMIPTAQARKVNSVKGITSTLPMGLNKGQVAALLQKEGVEFVYRRVDENFLGDSDVTDFGYTKSDLSGYTVAYIHGTPRSVVGECSVYFNFYFDKQGKLIKIADHTGQTHDRIQTLNNAVIQRRHDEESVVRVSRLLCQILRHASSE